MKFGQALAALDCSYKGARGLMYNTKIRQVEEEVARLLTWSTTDQEHERSSQVPVHEERRWRDYVRLHEEEAAFSSGIDVEIRWDAWVCSARDGS